MTPELRLTGRPGLVLLLLGTLVFVSVVWLRGLSHHREAALQNRILEAFRQLQAAHAATQAEVLRVYGGLTPHYDALGRAQRERGRLLQEIQQLLRQQHLQSSAWQSLWRLAQQEAEAHDALLEDFKTLHAPLRNILMNLPAETKALLEETRAHDRERGGALHPLLDDSADRLLVAALRLLQQPADQAALLPEIARQAAQLEEQMARLPPALQARVRLIVQHARRLGASFGHATQLLAAATQPGTDREWQRLRAHWLAFLNERLNSRQTEIQSVYLLALLLLTAFATAFLGLRRQLASIARAREAIAAQSALSRAVFDSSHDGILVTDDRGRIEAANPGVERMFGWPVAGLAGRNVLALGVHEQPAPSGPASGPPNDLDSLVPLAGKPPQVLRGRRRDGQAFDLDLVVTAAASDGSQTGARRLVAVIRDISQRLRVERAIATLAATGSGQTLTDSGRLAGNEAFYQKCVQALAEAFGADYAFIGELVSGKELGQERARTRAFWHQGQFLPPMEYAVADTPCEQLLHTPHLLVTSGLRDRYPMLARLGLEADSYFGVAIRSGSALLGQLAVLHRGPLAVEEWMHSLLQVYAARIGLVLLRERAERALFASRELSRVTLHSIGEAVITTDEQARVTALNPAASQLSGWTDEAARGRPFTEVFALLHERTLEPLPCPAAACLASGQVARSEAPALLRRRDGQAFAVEHTAAPIRTRDGHTAGAVLVLRDVSEQRALRQRLDHQARHDALTGLINRAEFERQVQAALAASRERGAEHALLYLDLDQFKIVNDTCGHMAGDALLQQLADVFRHSVRSGDVLARLGGDEFGVLLLNCPLPQALPVAAHLRAAVADWVFQWGGRGFQVGVSIGAVPITRNSESYAALLADADLACYTAKEQGRNQVYVHTGGDTPAQQRRGEMFWAGRVREALTRPDGLTLFRQPVYAIQHPGHQPVLYDEVLVRLPSPEGLLDPLRFLPAAVRYGLMPQLDRQVLRLALEHLRRLPESTVFAVNLSGKALSDDDGSLLPFLTGLIEHSGVSPRRLCFEITETTAITSLTRASQLMRALRKLGCRFALDDFGTGFSSYAYLKQLPINYLKIDGQFVRDISRDPLDRAIVASTHQVAHAMGISTVAENVEDAATLDILRDLGVDYAQGYFFARPEPLPPLPR